MNFLELNCRSSGFTLVREDGLHVFLPYSAIERVLYNPSSLILHIDAKKHGSFIKTYPNEEELKHDFIRITAKGKV